MKLSKDIFFEKPSRLERLYSVDFLRGIAALLVCLFHFTNGNSHFLDHGNWLKQIGSIGWTSVEIFFILSGFIIPYSLDRSHYHYKTFKHFMLKRLLRIEPPYLAAIFFVLAVNYLGTLSPYYRGEDFNINYFNLLLHLGYLNGFFGHGWLNPVFWTLAIEFQFYLLMELLFPMLHRTKKYVQISILVLLLVSAYFIKSAGFIFHFLPYFILGIILYFRKIKQWSTKLSTFAELSLIVIIWFTFSRVEFYASTFTWLILLLVQNRKKRPNLHGWVKYHTLSI
ncbi:acyltransferase [Pedobacter agri]|uniref:acyltransferase family protein n=1 Tax=Pedobacter agri TaxID=454586 RepID=UPI00292CBB50|nr:acyltransferase [Pedobacter agri]